MRDTEPNDAGGLWSPLGRVLGVDWGLGEGAQLVLRHAAVQLKLVAGEDEPDVRVQVDLTAGATPHSATGQVD